MGLCNVKQNFQSVHCTIIDDKQCDFFQQKVKKVTHFQLLKYNIIAMISLNYMNFIYIKYFAHNKYMIKDKASYSLFSICKTNFYELSL